MHNNYSINVTIFNTNNFSITLLYKKTINNDSEKKVKLILQQSIPKVFGIVVMINIHSMFTNSCVNLFIIKMSK